PTPVPLAFPTRRSSDLHVLVQLPVCDEGPLAVRVAASAARLDWPVDRLTIQLLDDGDGEGHDELVASVRAMVPEEINFQILRRRSEEHTSELQSPCNLV